MERYNTLPDLAKAAAKLQETSFRDLFANDPDRVHRFSLSLPCIHADFSRQKIDRQVLDLLCEFAEQRQVAGFLQQMAEGKTVNSSQNRAALHMAARGHSNDLPRQVDPENWESANQRITDFVSGLDDGTVTGADNRRISTIVHIGIGGSELGPKTVYTALKRSVRQAIKLRFVANLDPACINDALSGLDPAATLIMVVSKSFTTLETLANAKIAQSWLQQHLGKPAGHKQIFAVTNNREKAISFGVPEQQVFDLPEEIGGRFSLWSSVGVSLAAALGIKTWRQLLDGARAMDRHVLQAPARENMPMLAALISFWNLNFLKLPGRAIIPYSERLAPLVSWAQQLLMESNGKSVQSDGSPAALCAAPIVFGDAGTNAQHAVFQALHQGKTPIPVDLIAVLRDRENNLEQHRQVLANMLGQASALMVGRDSEDPQKHFAGNRPSTTVLLDDLSAFALGKLLAFYEHETVILAHLCAINPFDQWGVELGKSLAATIEQRLSGAEEPKLDIATEAVLQRIKAKQSNE